MAERRTWALTIAAAGFALIFARAQTDAAPPPPPPGEAFAIVAQSPNLELRFRGVSLRNARTDEQQNQIALDFNGPVDGKLFDQIQSALPDWVDMAYAGYDNAVIRAKRPVQFLTRGESDGFSLRLVPAATQVAAQQSPPPPRPPPPQDMGGAQRADNPFGLRGSEDSVPGLAVRMDVGWHHANKTNVAGLRFGTDIPVADGFKIVGMARVGYANGNSVRQIDGSFAALRKSDVSGSLGVGYAFNDASDIKAYALYSAAGFGAAVIAEEHSSTASLGFAGAWRDAYFDTAEAAADRGKLDTAKIYGSYEFSPALLMRVSGHYNRYGVKNDDNTTTTAGFEASVRAPDIFGLPLGVGYDVEGDYILSTKHYLDPSLNPFVPMNIRTMEVHALSLFSQIPLGENASFDVMGGYAIDRYGKNGPFGGADFVVEPADGWKLVLGGFYSQVPNRQGETGTTISANLRLVYDTSGADVDAFTPSFLPDPI